MDYPLFSLQSWYIHHYTATRAGEDLHAYGSASRVATPVTPPLRELSGVELGFGILPLPAIGINGFSFPVWRRSQKPHAVFAIAKPVEASSSVIAFCPLQPQDSFKLRYGLELSSPCLDRLQFSKAATPAATERCRLSGERQRILNQGAREPLFGDNLGAIAEAAMQAASSSSAGACNHSPQRPLFQFTLKTSTPLPFV